MHCLAPQKIKQLILALFFWQEQQEKHLTKMILVDLQNTFDIINYKILSFLGFLNIQKFGFNTLLNWKIHVNHYFFYSKVEKNCELS